MAATRIDIANAFLGGSDRNPDVASVRGSGLPNDEEASKCACGGINARGYCRRRRDAAACCRNCAAEIMAGGKWHGIVARRLLRLAK